MIENYIAAGVIFIVSFYFIISGKVDRTIASFAGALAMVATGSAMGFYSQEEAFGTIDFNVIGLLIGMMVIVSVCKKTGFFSYVAIKTAKASKGSPLRLLVMMGLISAFLSMALDNVTTIILIIPITILICDILGISPLPMIMGEIILANIGGVGTMIGDPPNMMIASSANFSFNDFIIHLLPIVLGAMALSIGVLALVFRKDMAVRPRDFRPILQINESHAIKDKKALAKVVFSLALVFALFIVQKRLGLHHAFVALLGAGALLIFVRPDIKEVMREVEWPVLIFFVSLFVLIGGVERAGILSVLARQITALASANYNFAKVFILWSAGLFSSLIGAIPFTTAMLPVIKHIGKLGVETNSLWWILALGAGFGGCGTPIGTLAGVVGLSMSERTRTPIDFKTWFRAATVVMLVTLIFVTLLITII